MTKPMTLEKLLERTSESLLVKIEHEIITGVVPTYGVTHKFIRRINHMIDQGKLCINPTSYRKVYLPTFAKAVQKELARRYMLLIEGKEIFKEAPEQLTLEDFD